MKGYEPEIVDQLELVVLNKNVFVGELNERLKYSLLEQAGSLLMFRRKKECIIQ